MNAPDELPTWRLRSNHYKACAKRVRLRVTGLYKRSRSLRFAAAPLGYSFEYSSSNKIHKVLSVVDLNTGDEVNFKEEALPEGWDDFPTPIFDPHTPGYYRYHSLAKVKEEVVSDFFVKRSYIFVAYQPETPCDCDSFPSYPTCSKTAAGWKTYKKNRPEADYYVRQRPGRCKVKSVLKEATARYNSSMEDFDPEDCYGSEDFWID